MPTTSPRAPTSSPRTPSRRRASCSKPAGHGDDFASINARAVAAARRSARRERPRGCDRRLDLVPAAAVRRARVSRRTQPSAPRTVELAETLAEAGVDLLALEMMQETRHAPLACEAARAVGLPVWLGVSCKLGAGGASSAFDFPLVSLAECLDALLPFAPAAVNVMHSPVAAVEPALRELRARWPGPLGAYPEIGDGTPHTPYAGAQSELATHARGWVAQRRAHRRRLLRHGAGAHPCARAGQ